MTWLSIKTRCLNPKAANYWRYGGRGITVCDRWEGSFLAFLADMGVRPDRTSIDRIDNDGPYSPENCRWATNAEQANNKATNRHLTLNGRTMTLTEWARDIGASRRTLWMRLRYGWSIERALTQPIGRYSHGSL